jgi:lipopolysaccharide biosynthesis regulator YciM
MTKIYYRCLHCGKMFAWLCPTCTVSRPNREAP